MREEWNEENSKSRTREKLIFWIGKKELFGANRGAVASNK